MSLETREIKVFWRDLPGFCRDIPAVPEKFENKKVCVQFSSPNFAERSAFSNRCDFTVISNRCGFAIEASKLLRFWIFQVLLLKRAKEAGKGPDRKNRLTKFKIVLIRLALCTYTVLQPTPLNYRGGGSPP